jgi:hypothetical protein
VDTCHAFFLERKLSAHDQSAIGQKFHIGEIVRISNPESWFSKMSVDADKERLYEIQYSYFQKYGGDQAQQTKSYSLKHLFEKNSSAWYEEAELELNK